MFKPTALKRTLFFVFFDIVLSLGTLFLAYSLRFNFVIPESFLDNFFDVFLLIIIFKITTFHFFNLYNVSWRFFSLYEAKKLIIAHLITYSVFIVIFYLVPSFFNPFPRSIILIDFVLSILLLGMLRFTKRLIVENGQDTKLTKTLLVGVTSFGQSLLKQKNDFYIVSVVDDQQNMVGTYISNIKVAGFHDIEKVIKEKEISSVIIAKNFDQKTLSELHETFARQKIYDIKVLSINSDQKELKELSVEDLLARHPKDLDKVVIKDFISGKKVLVTGAGGSIGSEISRQCANFGAKELILLDHSEYNLYTITEELESYNIKLVMQSVVQKELLEKTFHKYMPDIVIHAAAYKHVPLCEENITEAIQNNIIGTKNTIDCAIQYKVKKFVLISTDKAVRPTNVMGATKRVCELYLQNVQSSDTELVAVRFGNVLGSSGSVIPKFKSQIAKGGPITVTHPEITRYFMLIPEACELVLQAASLGKDAEIFILDMGEPIKIIDLAKKMIELSGKDDIEIKFTGLREGEKLYEELLFEESEQRTGYDSITIAGKTQYDINKLVNDIEVLLQSSQKVLKLQEIVPEFKRKTF